MIPAQDILDNMPVHIYIKDKYNKFIYINRAYALAFGLSTPAKAKDLTDRDIFSEIHAQEARDDELEIMRTGRPLVDKEEQETWPDGRRTWVLTSKLPLRDERGEIIGTFGISKDITQTKAELERYRLAVEGAQDGLWHRVFRTQELWFSSRWKAILGYSDDEMPNSLGEWEKRVHPDDRGRVDGAIWEHLVGHTPTFECEFRMRHKSGGYRWVRARGMATRDAKGNLKAFAGSHIDITETKNRDDFYRRVLEAIPSLVFVKDRHLRFTYINRSVAEAVGLPEDQILGKMDRDINPNKEQVAHFEENDRRVLETGMELAIEEERLVDATGRNKRILATKKLPLVTPGGPPETVQVLGVSTDIITSAWKILMQWAVGPLSG